MVQVQKIRVAPTAHRVIIVFGRFDNEPVIIDHPLQSPVAPLAGFVSITSINDIVESALGDPLVADVCLQVCHDDLSEDGGDDDCADTDNYTRSRIFCQAFFCEIRKVFSLTDSDFCDRGIGRISDPPMIWRLVPNLDEESVIVDNRPLVVELSRERSLFGTDASNDRIHPSLHLFVTGHPTGKEFTDTKPDDDAGISGIGQLRRHAINGGQFGDQPLHNRIETSTHNLLSVKIGDWRFPAVELQLYSKSDFLSSVFFRNPKNIFLDRFGNL